MSFTIRDLWWLTALIAVIVSWSLDHKSLSKALYAAELKADILQLKMRMD
jgi:hypothetical protein